ncbi:MAG: hypothetical protein JWO80_4974 [Bryobacterales bacterium]|nr:hypothetical protein [Bryobacterales bacterium]
MPKSADHHRLWRRLNFRLRQPSPLIRDEESDAVRAILHSGIVAEPCLFLREVRRIRVTHAPLKSFEGTLVRRDGTGWVLRAYPGFRNVVVRLNSSVFPEPKSVTCDAGPATAQTPTVVNGLWSVHTMGANYCKW